MEKPPISFHMVRGPPPLCLREDDITPPYLLSTAVIYCVVTATRDKWKHTSEREPYLFRSHQRSPILRDPSTAALASSTSSMDLGCGGDIVHVRLCSWLHHSSGLRRYVKSQTLVGLELGPMADIWSGSPRHPLRHLLSVNVDVNYGLDGRRTFYIQWAQID